MALLRHPARRPHAAASAASSVAVLLALAASALPAAAQTTYGPGPGGDLVDATAVGDETFSGRFTSDIVLNFAGVTVDQVTSVTLTNLTHTYIADLAISLLHVESGQSVVLTSPPDDTAANFGGTYTFVVDPGLQTIDQVTRNTNTSFVVPTGSYAISDYAGEGGENGPRTDFTAFAGIPLSGTWRLSIEDFEVLGTGTLGSWSFAATTTSAAAIPEPGTLALLPLGALALAGAGAARRRRRKSAAAAATA